MPTQTQREVLRAVIQEGQLLRRFDGALFHPGTIMEEVEYHYKGTLNCFQSDGCAFDEAKVGPGRFLFFRYGWLQPVVPELLTLSEGNAARLNPLNSRVLANSIAHVDRLFRTVQYRGLWWLYLKTDTDPTPTLFSPDYYLLRHVHAVEDLQAVMHQVEEELDAAEDATPVEHPIHIWKETFNERHYTPN